MPEQNSAPSVPKPEVKPAEPFRRPHNALIVDKDMFLKEEVKPVVPVRSAGRGAKRAIPKSKPAKVLSYALLLLMGLLVGFGGYYFYAKYGSRSARTGTNRNAEVATAPVPQTEVEAGDETTAEGQLDTEPSEPKNTRATNETAGNESEEAPAQPIATPPASTSTTAEAPETTTTLGRYKVISKAYFHNEPDEDTRRKAFIIHWNNAVLMPVEEKNGFMYVEFTNHLGQTSKGWLLKKDLQKLN
jgi:serine/threonine-protein kinase